MRLLEHMVPVGIRRKWQTLNNKINYLYAAVSRNDVLWNNEYERQFIKKNFGDVSQLPDFVDRFKRLISGLDEESVACLVKVIFRQKAIISTQENKMDFYSEDEKRQLRKVYDEFDHEVVKLKEGVYAYKNYLLPINHFEKSVFYYKHGIDGLKTVDGIKDTTVMDVGGFIGDSALVFSKLSPRRIFSFEPVPENRFLMEKTIELNSLTNVFIVDKALGNQEGTMTMNVLGSESSVCDINSATSDCVIGIDVTTLDKYVEQNEISDISLIKVDIEGAEQLFLEGAKQTISQQKPILLISIYHNKDDFFDIKPLIESWDLGYSFRIHKPLIENATSEILLICEPSWY